MVRSLSWAVTGEEHEWRRAFEAKVTIHLTVVRIFVELLEALAGA